MGKNYEWIKLILGTVIFLAHDKGHVNGLPFIIMFILGNVVMIILDIVYRKGFKEKWGTILWIYMLYNYIGFRILGFDLLHP